MIGMSGRFSSWRPKTPLGLHRSTSVRHLVLSATAVLAVAGALDRRATGAVVQLIDNNSVVDFDTSSQLNSQNWLVEGVDQLHQQAFWYRVGNAAEQSLDTVPHLANAVNANFNPGLDTLNIRYTQAGSFQIDVAYTLSGGAPGSGSSGLTENITIKNLTASPLDFHFFQYSDFDLAGTAANDGVIFTNGNAVQQFDGVLAFSETVVTTAPSHRELGLQPATLNKLNDGVATTLSDTPVGLPVGPGNVTWAYQWDFSIPANGSVNIGKAKNVNYVPEPGSALLISLSALALFGMRSRRRSA
jgi:hypothetical protein